MKLEIGDTVMVTYREVPICTRTLDGTDPSFIAVIIDKEERFDDNTYYVECLKRDNCPDRIKNSLCNNGVIFISPLWDTITVLSEYKPIVVSICSRSFKH